MPNTFIQGNAFTTTSTGTALTLAYGSNVGNGNLLVAAWRLSATSPLATTVTDTIGNSWTIVYDAADGGGGGGSTAGGWAYTFSKAAGANTVSLNFASSQTALLAIGEWNGVTAARNLSAIAQSSGTALTSAAVSTQPGDLLIGVAEVGTAGTMSPGSGYTIREQATAGGVTYVVIQDNLSGPGGSLSSTVSTTVSSNFTAGIGAFISTPSGGGDLGPSFDFRIRI